LSSDKKPRLNKAENRNWNKGQKTRNYEKSEEERERSGKPKTKKQNKLEEVSGQVSSS